MSSPPDAQRVRRMFDGIARRYDFLNHLLSLNLDRRWRRLAAREATLDGAERILDLCGGTGDLTLELARAAGGASIICCDFSHPMLDVAQQKFQTRGLADRCRIVAADALQLPFNHDSIDAVTVAFGVRNLESMSRGLQSIRNVLRPGGRLVILEFSHPTGPVLSRLYRIYLQRILPRIGDRVSRKEGPYGYLAETISDFPDPETLAGTIRKAGFSKCTWTPLSGGIVCLHTATK